MVGKDLKARSKEPPIFAKHGVDSDKTDPRVLVFDAQGVLPQDGFHTPQEVCDRIGRRIVRACQCGNQLRYKDQSVSYEILPVVAFRNFERKKHLGKKRGDTFREIVGNRIVALAVFWQKIQREEVVKLLFRVWSRRREASVLADSTKDKTTPPLSQFGQVRPVYLVPLRV